MTESTRLLDDWAALLARVMAGADRDLVEARGAELLARYGEPHRRYHDTAHLAELLDRVAELRSYAAFPDLVRLAGWFHDAVHDPARSDNEQRSAELAERTLDDLRVMESLRAEVSRLVRLTAGHEAAPTDRNGQVLCDADLAVLARPPADYDRYAAAVRAEYPNVPDAVFRTGRARILRTLLDRPSIYATPPARAGWEAPARANLERELSHLVAD